MIAFGFVFRTSRNLLTVFLLSLLSCFATAQDSDGDGILDSNDPDPNGDGIIEPGIITGNFVLAADEINGFETYHLEGILQIPQGSSLTLVAGVNLTGPGFNSRFDPSSMIEVFGELNVNGSVEQKIEITEVMFEADDADGIPKITLEHMSFKTGTINGNGDALVTIKDSVIDDLRDEIGVKYRNGYEEFTQTIERNVFLGTSNTPRIIEFNSGILSLNDNFFTLNSEALSTRVPIAVDINIWKFNTCPSWIEGKPMGLTIERNSFLYASGTAVRFSEDACADALDDPFDTSVVDNYWNTLSSVEISNLIEDKSDDLNLWGPLPFEPFLSKPSDQTPTSHMDSDGDGLLNFVDEDDDNDGLSDVNDNCPLANDPNQEDFDQDGRGNPCDPDDDGDGVEDTIDEFPLDPTEAIDTDNDGVGDNSDEDDDNDGISDEEDAFPLDPAEFLDTDGDGIGNNADTDDDGDGISDVSDDFPLDNSETRDSDSDGIGDNTDEDDDNDGTADTDDAFPFDPSETLDTDADGIGNNADIDDDDDGVADSNDAFPLNPEESIDTDGDGTGDNTDVDDDNDGVEDDADAFPLDAAESVDTDGDGIGDNADSDDDGDGIDDLSDAFPLDVSESSDTDGDGIGNNEDKDDDGDGVDDADDDFPLDPAESVDTDNDGIGNNADEDDDGDGIPDSWDNCPITSNAGQIDSDGDGRGNLCDADDDGDGVDDWSDAIPLDASETDDTDGDGVGNNTDTDDDGDGVEDFSDAFPLDASESVDTDNDGIGNNADADDDGDGIEDYADAFPLDPTETLDTDGDGIGNNRDGDDDGDGVNDEADAYPLDASETEDTDGDGIGNNLDLDDDGDGTLDTADAFPLNELEDMDFDGDGIGDRSDPDDDNDGTVDENDLFPYAVTPTPFLDVDITETQMPFGLVTWFPSFSNDPTVDLSFKELAWTLREDGTYTSNDEAYRDIGTWQRLSDGYLLTRTSERDITIYKSTIDAELYRNLNLNDLASEPNGIIIAREASTTRIAVIDQKEKTWRIIVQEKFDWFAIDGNDALVPTEPIRTFVLPPREYEILAPDTIFLPFNASELIGDWSFQGLNEDDYGLVDHCYAPRFDSRCADIVSFNANNTAHLQVSNRSATWGINASGDLELSFPDNGTVMTIRKLSNGDETVTALVHFNTESASLTAIEMMVKEDPVSVDPTRIRSFFEKGMVFTGSTVTSRARRSAVDGGQIGGVGFELYPDGQGIEYATPLWSQNESDNGVALTFRDVTWWMEGSELLVEVCTSQWSNGNCYSLRSDRYIPIKVTENRIYALRLVDGFYDTDGDGYWDYSYWNSYSSTVFFEQAYYFALSDVDRDGVENNADAFPVDETEWQDFDGDFIGDNKDLDDDNDGFSDSEELSAGSNPLDAMSVPSDSNTDIENSRMPIWLKFLATKKDDGAKRISGDKK